MNLARSTQYFHKPTQNRQATSRIFAEQFDLAWIRCNRGTLIAAGSLVRSLVVGLWDLNALAAIVKPPAVVGAHQSTVILHSSCSNK